MKLKENDNVPEIRFDSFKEEWDKKRFKDFTKLSQGLQIAISSRFLEDGEHRYFYITNEFLNPNSTKKYYIESPSENVICTVDDILMTRTGNTGKVITNISGAFHNNFFKVDYDKFETSKMFLYYLLTSNDIQKEIIIRAGNSTIPDLNHSDFYSIKTSLPALDEQSAIGSLFRTLDDLLASYKDNLANYQSLKATMLSKMFPKDGQTVPEIRLEGFERKWEKKKLIDLVSPVSRKVKKPSDPYYRLSIRSHAKGTFKQFVDDPKKIAMDNLFEVKENDLVVNITFAWEHAIAVASKEDDGLLVSHRFPTFVIDKSDKNFINIYIKREEFRQKMDLLSPGGAGRNRVLNVKDFIKIQMIVPELREQLAIGAYFSNLDNIIHSYQEKVAQLETLKKKLLQDMFI